MALSKLKIGDVAEIKTPAGGAYVQYTHDGKDMGELVRVLPGLYSSRPPNLAILAQEREMYFIFYTLKYAVRGGQAEIMCNLPIPEWARPEPLMRHAAGRAPDGKVTGWRVVPALHPLTVDFLLRTPVLRELTREQRRLSIHQLRPHPAMVEELARGWTPECAEILEDQDRAEARAKRANKGTSQTADDGMKHYLYFRKKKDADRAGEQLCNRGYSVEVRRGADGESWLALATKAGPKTAAEMDELRDEMESLAARFGGEYDGWEAAVDSLASQNAERGRKVN